MEEINKGPRPVGQQGQDMVNKAAAKVDGAIGAAQQGADKVADKVSEKVADVRAEAAPVLAKVGDQAQQLLKQGREALQDTTQRVRETLTSASGAAIAYTKDEPTKSLLVAAATGALLMGVLVMMTRSRD